MLDRISTEAPPIALRPSQGLARRAELATEGLMSTVNSFISDPLPIGSLYH
jgi:hypothetical protein